MFTTLVTAGIAGSTLFAPPAPPAARPVGVFTASFTVSQPAPEGLTGVTGAATISVDDRALSFTVQLAGVSKVTDVILLSGLTAVPLHAGPASAGEVLEIEGGIPAASLNGVTLPELTRQLLAGGVEVVVFTERYPAGDIRGRLNGAMVEVDEPVSPNDPVTAIRPTGG